MQQAIVASSEARDVTHVGGKASALARLVALGFDVPAFFVVDPAFIAGNRLPDLRAALEHLGPGPYAVRSSGREEDGAAHSHAGQFLSLLDVDAPGVGAAVERVWRSGMNDSVKAYRASRGLDPEGGAPAVIVQRMVKARAAGVAFSADPVDGRRDRIVVSATEGTGDRLVGGEVDGDQYVIDALSGDVVAQPSEGVLSPSDIAALRQLVGRVERAVGTPQDIEWAFEDDRLFLLQSRAITTALRAPVNPDDSVTIFDNSNIVESYPGLVSPLTYSFAQYAYARVYRAFLGICRVPDEKIRANASALENMLGRLDGRVYYNLGNWYRLLALLPGFANNRAHMETMMGVAEPLPREIADALSPPPVKGFAAVREWARILRMVVALGRETVRLPRTIDRFYARLETALSIDKSAIDAMQLTALASHYRRIEADLLDRWDAPLVNDFLCMVAFGASRRLMQRWLGQEGLSLHNDVMIGQGDIVSAEPPRRIAEMGRLVSGDADMIAALESGDRAAAAGNPELARLIDAYIARFGDRCTEELKLESIPLDENPASLLASIAASARRSGAAGMAGSAKTGNGAARIDALLAGKPIRRWVMRRVLSVAKARVRDRENLRFERTRIFGHARRVLLAMGRQLHAIDRLDHPRDIFQLTIAELLGAIEGFGVDHDLKAIVAVRKAARSLDEAAPDPGERVTFRGAVAARTRRCSPQPRPAPGGDATLLEGTGCSAGRVTARARVIRDPAHERLQPGEVLVARHTDPGWIALFSNASAIVVERGSLLSHSAIVARELGIPCVVALKNAMTLISDGEMIEVDGASGRVRKVA